MTKNATSAAAEVPGRPDPELAVTPEWCAEMRAARRARGMNQTALAKAIKPATSQATISTIEKGVDDTGRPVASDRVLPICRVLGIAPPVVGQTAAMMRWIAVGRALEHRSPELLASQIDTMERMVRAMAPSDDTVVNPDQRHRH